MRRAIGRRIELGGLTTREADDPSITLLDAAATVLDVLAFYGELIANESYLRTATERRSVGELARAIGYELGPGVAASTMLAFSIDPPPGTPADVIVPAGTTAQKIPGPDGRSAAYETTADVIARKELNELRLRQLVPTTPAFADDVVHLAGIGHGLGARGASSFSSATSDSGDPASEAWDVRTVIAIDEIPAQTSSAQTALLTARSSRSTAASATTTRMSSRPPPGCAATTSPSRPRSSGTRRCATPTCRSRCVLASSILTPSRQRQVPRRARTAMPNLAGSTTICRPAPPVVAGPRRSGDHDRQLDRAQPRRIPRAVPGRRHRGGQPQRLPAVGAGDPVDDLGREHRPLLPSAALRDGVRRRP